MVGVGRDLCGSSSPTPLPKQGHLQQAAQELVQVGLEYLQRRRLYNLPGEPVPVLRHPQREEVLPHVQLDLPKLQFVPIAPCPVTGHHWKELGPILLTPTFQIFVSIYKVPSQPSPLQAEQAQLPHPPPVGEMLQSPHHPCSPPLDSLQQLFILPELGSPELDRVQAYVLLTLGHLWQDPWACCAVRDLSVSDI